MSYCHPERSFAVDIFSNKILLFRALVFEDSHLAAKASGIRQYRAWRASLKCNCPAFLSASSPRPRPSLSTKFGPLRKEAFDPCL